MSTKVYIKVFKTWAGQVFQWLRTDIALVEDLTLVPSRHVIKLRIICNSNYRGSPECQGNLHSGAHTPFPTENTKT